MQSAVGNGCCLAMAGQPDGGVLARLLVGRTGDRAVGGARHAIEPRTSTEEKIRHEFAAELSDFLNEARVANRYDNLVLMAAPAFLGSVRSELDPQVARMVTHALDKQITDASMDRIREELSHLH